MKGNLMVNLKEYFISLRQEENILTLITYYELVKQNQDKLEELLIHSELTDYTLSYNVIDGYSRVLEIKFKQDESIGDSVLTYELTFTSYGSSNCVDISKCYKVGRFDLLDEEIDKDVYVDWEETLKACKLQEMRNEIIAKKEYILAEQQRLIELEEDMNKLEVL